MPQPAPLRFEPAGSCLDYRNFRCRLSPALTAAACRRLENELTGIGDRLSRTLGVTRVHGDWGFVTLPPPGFPECRVSFFHDVPADRIDTLLRTITHRLQTAREEGEQ
jgi:hypothetical protein